MIFLHFLSLTSRRHYWEFEIQDKEVPRCPELEMEGTNTSCIFYFSICEKVPSYCPAGSGICLAKKVSPLKYPNITLYTRFIDIGTASEVFDSGRTLVLFSQHSQWVEMQLNFLSAYNIIRVSLRGGVTVKNVGLSLAFEIHASVQVKKGGPKILPKLQEKLEIHIYVHI